MVSVRSNVLRHAVAVVTVGVAVLLVQTRHAVARAPDLPLREILETADTIAIVHVQNIEEVRDWKIALGRVEKAFKGSSASQTIAFVAQPTWTCCVSTADKDERVLLFLNKVSRASSSFGRLPAVVSARFGDDVTLFCIANSGRGRMPLQRWNGKDFASSWYLPMPSRLKAVDEPEPVNGVGKCYSLQSVEKYIRWALAPASKEANSNMTVGAFLESLQNDDVDGWYESLKSAHAIASQSEQLVPRLIDIAKSNEYPGAWRVPQAFVQLGVNAVPYLLSALEEDDPEVRRIAASGLGEVRPVSNRVIGRLSELLADSDTMVVAAAAYSLAEMAERAKSAVPALVSALVGASTFAEEWQQYRVREAVARALAKIGSDAKEAIPALIDCLKYRIEYDKGFYFTDPRGATLALAGIGAPSVPALTIALDHENPEVRLGAVQALGRIGPAARTAVMKVNELASQVEHEQVRSAAIEALNQIRGTEEP